MSGIQLEAKKTAYSREYLYMYLILPTLAKFKASLPLEIKPKLSNSSRLHVHRLKASVLHMQEHF